MKRTVHLIQVLSDIQRNIQTKIDETVHAVSTKVTDKKLHFSIYKT